jgi:Fe-S cluster assembly protein SufD
MKLVIDQNKEYIIPNSENLEILVKENINATIIEKNDSNRSIKMELLNNSIINYLAIDKAKDTNKDITLNNDSSLNMITSNFNGGNKNINVKLEKENSTFNLKSIIMMKDEIDNETIKVYHNDKNTTSLIENYITSNNANVNIDVIGKIEKNMSNSNCVQKSRGIILSNNSSIKIKPVLLIDEFDVSANHGCAIGKIDEEGLYYLMSRGISKKDAEMLIIKGFLSPILNSLTNEEMKNELVMAQDSKL